MGTPEPGPPNEPETRPHDPTPGDFTGEDIGPPRPFALGPQTRPYDPTRHREWVRGLLAGGLAVVFGIVVLGSLGAVVVRGAQVEAVTSLLEVILPPVVALTGTAIGFYFGGQGASPPSPR